MSTTEITEVSEPKTAAQALIAVMRDVDFVAKTRQTEAQGRYMFRGIDEVINAIAKPLRAAGCFIVPTLIDKSAEVQPTNAGGHVNLVRVTAQFAIYGELGDPIIGSAPGEAFDSGDKATAKAMSVAFRTFLLQALAIPTNEPDPDEVGFERGTDREQGSTQTSQHEEPLYYKLGQALNEQFRTREDRTQFVTDALGRPLFDGETIATMLPRDIEHVMVRLEAYRKARIEGRPMHDAKDFLARFETHELNGAGV
jgi:hypothetical protein